MVASGLSILLGISTLFRTPQPNPFWPKLQELSPLDSAPIAPGTRGILVPPVRAGQEEWPFWLLEAHWRRPDLLLALPTQRLWSNRPAFAVSVGQSGPPPGWRVVWHLGAVFVAKPGVAP